MFFSIQELEKQRMEFDQEFRPGAIEFGPDLRQKGPLRSNGHAELIEEHRGHKQTVEDVRIVGSLSAQMEVACARCLEPVSQAVGRQFDLLYRPLGVDRRGVEVSINTPETEIGYYEGDGILLEDVLREQVLLALPLKAVCSDACKGLCPQCGRNLNTGACDCAQPAVDSRWEALKDLKRQL
jgi:uncharacterized protein